ncbi:hypothetical protein ACFX2H_019710 [Malus domestica]
MSSTSPLPGPAIAQFLKLNDSNYLTWLRQIKPFLVGHDLWKVVNGFYPPPPATFTVTATPSSAATNSDSSFVTTTFTLPNPTFAHLYQHDQLVVSYIAATLTEPVLALTVGHDSAQAVWACLQRRFAYDPVLNSVALRYQLLDISNRSCSIADYLQHAKSLADKLATIGRPVDLEDFITVVLRGLGSDYLTLTTAIINVTILLTFEELTSKIEAFDLQNLRTSTTSAAL